MTKLNEQKSTRFSGRCKSVFVILALAFVGALQITCSAPTAGSLPAVDLQGMETFAAEKIRALMQEVEKNPDDAEAWGKLAMNLDIHDLKNESVPCYEQAIALAPQTFRWRYYRAMVADEIGAPETLELYEKAHSIQPDYPPLLYRYGKALRAHGKTAAAKSVLTQAAESKDPSAAAFAFWELAEIELVNDNLHESRELLLESLQRNPNNREVRSMLATVYSRLGESEKAEFERSQLALLPERTSVADRFVEQLQAEGVSAYWFSQHGRRHLDFGNYQAALDAFRMEHRIKPTADSHNSLGMTYQYLGRHEDAVSHFREAVSKRSEYAEAYNNLAVSLYSLQQSEDAVEALQQAIALKPEYADPHLNLGTFHIIAGQTEKAIAVFSRAMAQAEFDIRIAGRLAWMLATSQKSELRNGKKAVRLAERVCEVTGYQHPDNLDILAAAYAETKNFRKAVETAKRASELAHEAKMTNLARLIDYRLDLYRRAQPFRDPEL